jgi:hypothetical protein
MIDNPRSLARGFGEAIGKYLSSVMRGDDGASFAENWDPSAIKLSDVRSATFYSQAFDGELEPGPAASVTLFRCTINVLDLVLWADPLPETQEALFKLRFIFLYHLLAALRDVRAQVPRLGARSDSLLSQVENHSTTAIFRRTEVRPLSNTLTHYGLDSRFMTKDLKPHRPLSGLVEAYFPDLGFERMNVLLTEHVSRVAESLEAWADGLFGESAENNKMRYLGSRIAEAPSTGGWT